MDISLVRLSTQIRAAHIKRTELKSAAFGELAAFNGFLGMDITFWGVASVAPGYGAKNV